MSRERKRGVRVSVFVKNMRDAIQAIPTSPNQIVNWEKLEEKKRVALLSLEQLSQIGGDPGPTTGCSGPRLDKFYEKCLHKNHGIDPQSTCNIYDPGRLD